MIQVLCTSLSWDMEKVEFVYKLFTRGVLIFHSQLVLLVINPTNSQSQTLWGLFFPVQVFWAGEPDVELVELESLPLWGNIPPVGSG